MKALRLLLPLLIAAGLIWLTLRGQDLGQLWHAILQVSVPILALGITAEVGSIFLRAVRYRRLLHYAGNGGAFHFYLEGTVIGYFVTNIFPFRLGEIVRPLLISRDTGVKFPRLLAAAGLERLIDVLALAVCFALFIALAPDLLAENQATFGHDLMGRMFHRLAAMAEHRALVNGVIVVLLAALILIPWLLLRGRARIAARAARGGRLGKVAEALGHLVESASVLSRPVAALEIFFWSLLIQTGIVAGAMFLTAAGGLQVGFSAGLLLTVAVSLGYGIPVPGGLGGVQGAAFVCLATVLGKEPAKATAVGWVMWAAFVIPMILWGGWLVWRKGINIMGVVAEAKQRKGVEPEAAA